MGENSMLRLEVFWGGEGGVGSQERLVAFI